jgi:putative thioredoxin
VAALKDAQIIDQFVGLLPEDQLQQWFQAILPSPADDLAREAQTLRQTDPRAALGKLREAREHDPENASLKIQIADVLLELNQLDECRAIIAELETRGYLEPHAEQIKSQLDLRAAAEEAGPLSEARQAAEANPDDLSLQLKLADALAVAGKQEEALQICLTIIEKDKQGLGTQAKDTMLKIFDIAGSGSELTGTYRRKLATLLY